MFLENWQTYQHVETAGDLVKAACWLSWAIQPVSEYTSLCGYTGNHMNLRGAQPLSEYWRRLNVHNTMLIYAPNGHFSPRLLFSLLLDDVHFPCVPIVLPLPGHSPAHLIHDIPCELFHHDLNHAYFVRAAFFKCEPFRIACKRELEKTRTCFGSAREHAGFWMFALWEWAYCWEQYQYFNTEFPSTASASYILQHLQRQRKYLLSFRRWLAREFVYLFVRDHCEPSTAVLFDFSNANTATVSFQHGKLFVIVWRRAHHSPLADEQEEILHRFLFVCDYKPENAMFARITNAQVVTWKGDVLTPKTSSQTVRSLWALLFIQFGGSIDLLHWIGRVPATSFLLHKYNDDHLGLIEFYDAACTQFLGSSGSALYVA